MQIQAGDAALKGDLRGGILRPRVPKTNPLVEMTRDDVRRWRQKEKAVDEGRTEQQSQYRILCI